MPEGRIGSGTLSPTVWVCMCAFGVAGTQRDPTDMPHGAGYVPSPQVSGPWGCQQGCPQGLSQVPGRMVEGHLCVAF